MIRGKNVCPEISDIGLTIKIEGNVVDFRQKKNLVEFLYMILARHCYYSLIVLFS